MAVKVVINYRGIGELLNSPWAQRICEEAAAEICARQEGLEALPARHTGQRVAVTVIQHGTGNELMKATGGRHD